MKQKSYLARLADCQRKLLAALNWTNMFHERAETLKTKLDIAHKENEELAELTNAFDIKKDVSTSWSTDHKEVSTLEVFHDKKEASTPPPYDHNADHRALQNKGQPRCLIPM